MLSGVLKLTTLLAKVLHYRVVWEITLLWNFPSRLTQVNDPFKKISIAKFCYEGTLVLSILTDWKHLDSQSDCLKPMQNKIILIRLGASLIYIAWKMFVWVYLWKISSGCTLFFSHLGSKDGLCLKTLKDHHHHKVVWYLDTKL